jgi:hypothetical protein
MNFSNGNALTGAGLLTTTSLILRSRDPELHPLASFLKAGKLFTSLVLVTLSQLQLTQVLNSISTALLMVVNRSVLVSDKTQTSTALLQPFPSATLLTAQPQLEMSGDESTYHSRP